MTIASTLTFKTAAIAGLILLARSVDARIGANQPPKDQAVMEQGRSLAEDTTGSGSAVYVMTNRVSEIGNSVVVFGRSVEDGTLNRVGLFDTGGIGGLAAGPSGSVGTPSDALASQNSLILSESKRCLFAANAGSDTVTTFRLSNNGKCLDRVGVYPSGGSFPVSITQHDNTVYVLNAGGEATVSGFRYSDRLCTLAPISNSARSLKTTNTNPPFFLTSASQVSITPNGLGLVATVKGMNNIHYWSLSALGFPADEQVITPSNGFTPFSFTFDGNDNLLVTEAFGASEVAPPPPIANAGAVSSYKINDEDGSLSLISGSVPTGQTATCWVQYFNGYAYTTNNEAPNPSISILSVDQDGQLELVDSSAANREQGIDRPIDFGLSQDGEFLYALNAAAVEEGDFGRAGISVFQNNGASLELIENVQVGLPLTTTTPTFEETEGVFGLAVL